MQPDEQRSAATSSPFETPRFECVDCGNPEPHIMCIRWLERLRLFFGGKAATE